MAKLVKVKSLAVRYGDCSIRAFNLSTAKSNFDQPTLQFMLQNRHCKQIKNIVQHSFLICLSKVIIIGCLIGSCRNNRRVIKTWENP